MLVEYTPPTQKFDILICAIHATVEPGTADIAREIHAAGGHRCGLYIHWDKQHVTSRMFDDPLFDTVVRQYKTVISIHGMSSTDQIAHIGGLDKPAIRKLRQALRLPLNKVPPAHLRGTQIWNVANRAASRMGVQVEISYQIRHKSSLRSWMAQTIARTLIT